MDTLKFECFVAKVHACVCVPESGARGKESLLFLPPLSEDGDGESWYSWYWELLDWESESIHAGAS